MSTRIVLLLAGTILMGSASAQQKSHTSPAKKNDPKKSQTHIGTASYYANKFNGRRTANGEIFSQQKMTGASNIISLNTWVRVTNLRNNRKVVVKINDRMHPGNKRLIDLSRSAASQLGYTGHGLTKVKVEVLGKKQQAAWAGK